MTTITIYHGLQIYYDDAGRIRAEFSDTTFKSVDQAKRWINDQVAAGNLKTGFIPCPGCHGTGQIMESAPAPNAFGLIPCPNCNGSGLVADPEDDAPVWWDDSDDYEETAENCPRCNFILLQNKDTGFYHCSNIECKFESTNTKEI